ncbi:odorant receptor 131-2 [Chiloscyllium plagiosum]|uniref:odorant receptor 131-2 n=1 Tax=Chiloscyllium plagiosum TaxID=36176 RepID=UPI001CB84C0C|nr:odorant receptor 131-2 [Chiloscyllium plagiosum]
MNESGNSTINGEHLIKIRVFASVTSFVLLAFFNLVIDYTILSEDRLRSQARFVLLFHLLVSGLIYFGLSSTFYLLIYLEVAMSASCCLILLMFLMMSGSTILLTLTVMAVDRYFAICHPLKYSSFCTPCKIWILSSMTWVVSAVIPLILVSQHMRKEPSQMFTSCSISNFHSSYSMKHTSKILLICICTVLILFSYYKILVEGKRIGVLNRRNKRARSTILMHGVQLAVYIIPTFINFILQQVAHARKLDQSTKTLFEVLNFAFFSLAQCISPVIYGLRKEELWELTSHKFPCFLWDFKGTLELVRTTLLLPTKSSSPASVQTCPEVLTLVSEETTGKCIE